MPTAVDTTALQAALTELAEQVAAASSSAPAPGCCGEDWSWFDAGGVRCVAISSDGLKLASASWDRSRHAPR